MNGLISFSETGMSLLLLIIVLFMVGVINFLAAGYAG